VSPLVFLRSSKVLRGCCGVVVFYLKIPNARELKAVARSLCRHISELKASSTRHIYMKPKNIKLFLNELNFNNSIKLCFAKNYVFFILSKLLHKIKISIFVTDK